jgi:hypothetical protein
MDYRYGRMCVPLFAAGDLIDPPISVPIPKQLPLKPTKAPSPPDEPPAVSEVLNGFVVTLIRSLAHIPISIYLSQNAHP